MPNLTASQGLKFSFAMKFLEKKFSFVNNICSKFQGQKINTKKDIHTLPTCVVLRNNRGNHFTVANFDTLPRAEKLLIYYEILLQNSFYVNSMCAKFQGQKSNTKKDIQNLPTCVVVRNHFTLANFDTLPKTEFFSFHMNILA